MPNLNYTNIKAFGSVLLITVVLPIPTAIYAGQLVDKLCPSPNSFAPSPLSVITLGTALAYRRKDTET
ncbi:MAG: hypothetical protein IPL33_09130 [Sphingobacteriales bacterium]|nr:hypothetical protein [Sphingobacteriales bacterium]